MKVCFPCTNLLPYKVFSMTCDAYDNRLTGLWFSFLNRSSFLKSSITSNWDLKLRPVTRKKCKNANKSKKCKQIKQWCMQQVIISYFIVQFSSNLKLFGCQNGSLYFKFRRQNIKILNMTTLSLYYTLSLFLGKSCHCTWP